MSRTRLDARTSLKWLAVCVPLGLIVVIQYLSFARMGEVRELAHESQLRLYLGGVSQSVDDAYRGVAQAALDVPAEWLQTRRFDAIQDHFVKTTRPAVKQFFAGVFEDCSCKTQYFDPHRGTLALETDQTTQMAVLRVSVPWRVQQGRLLTQASLLVDSRDPNNRIVYRIISDSQNRIIGVVGMVVDTAYLFRTSVPAAVQAQLQHLPPDVQRNSIVRVQNGGGDVLYSNVPETGRPDDVTAPLGFAFDDLRVSVRSRHATAAQLASWSFRSQTALTVLMCVVILVAVGLAIGAERRATRLSQLKTDFVSNVTHELRTPLASIALMGEFLRSRRIPEPKVREYGGRIEGESYRLQRMVANILDIARIESNQRPYAFAPVGVESVVEQALRTVDLLVSQKGFQVHYVPPAAPLPAIRADRGAIVDVLVNVIDNAVKYSGDARDIYVRVERAAGHVAIQVIDQGIGVAPAEQEKIFEKFHRVGNGPAARAPGTGLGLTLVRHTVEAHGGTIRLESQPGQGTTFEIRLPIDTSTASAPSDEPATTSREALEPVQPQVPAGWARS